MSANGTYVNGVKGLTSYLQSGDLIKFGQVECQFFHHSRVIPEYAAKLYSSNLLGCRENAGIIVKPLNAQIKLTPR